MFSHTNMHAHTHTHTHTQQVRRHIATLFFNLTLHAKLLEQLVQQQILAGLVALSKQHDKSIQLNVVHALYQITRQSSLLLKLQQTDGGIDTIWSLLSSKHPDICLKAMRLLSAVALLPPKHSVKVMCVCVCMCICLCSYRKP